MDIGVLTLLSALLSTLSALPVKYDQRQEGDLNVQAHLDNFVIVLIPNNGALSLLDFIQLKKDANRHESKNPSESDKYVPPTTAMKSTSPNFPAGTSPYKVDLDKQAVGEMASVGEEVLIAQSAPVTLSKGSTKKESPTTASSDEMTSTQASVEVPVEQTKAADQMISSDKTSIVFGKTDSPAVKKDESDKNDEVKVEKSEQIPTIVSKSQKQGILPKAIDFSVEVSASLPRKTPEEEIPSIGFFPAPVRSSKIPASGLETGDVEAEKLKRLRSGLEEECGDCHRSKSRYVTLQLTVLYFLRTVHINTYSRIQNTGELVPGSQ